MKPIVYFFGTPTKGFVSYPQDHTKSFFQDFIRKARLTSQIVLHREDNLLYYGYVRRINERDYIGICLCIDRIYTKIEYLFSVFDDVFADFVEHGDILKINGNSKIVLAVDNFYSESVAMTEYSNTIIDKVNVSEANSQPLPPINFSISVNDCLELSLEETEEVIADATKRYCNLYIAKKNSEIERITSFKNLINKKNKELKELNDSLIAKSNQVNNLKAKNIKLQNKQRNTNWVGALVFVCVVLFAYIYIKVINPSEVTHYETGEFVYYGPLKDKKPHGIGVAIYPVNDKDGRKYYIGRFNNGEREDTTAILFYQDGDYYYGSMKGDKWEKGLLYMNSDRSHFKGTFVGDNIPYNGTWYDHRRAYRLINGEKVYR